MRTTPPGPARLYVTARKDTPFLVVYADPLRREKAGSRWRAKRVARWFADRAAAEKYQRETNDTLLVEGTAGAHFDANVRADAIAARQTLNAAGHLEVSLHQLATNYCHRVKHQAASAELISTAMNSFLEEKRDAEGRSEMTVRNLRVRLWRWIDRENILTVGDVTRDRVEPLRTQKALHSDKTLAPQTRRNDINAVSSFCTWLVDKRKLDYHPLKGLRRPHVPWRPPPILTAAECDRLLNVAATLPYDDCLATVAVMMFTGARPSELEQTRLYYGRHPVARIEGGKLRGQANRIVELMPAAVAWLKLAGAPERVTEWNKHARSRAMEAAGLTWKVDLLRHTFISHRVPLLDNVGAVALEGGTSETMIRRHYLRLVSPTDARAWAALRPGKRLTAAVQQRTIVS